MKLRRALFNPVVLSLVAAIAGGTFWWGGAAALAAGTWTTALVPIRGTVSAQPESVVFSGQAKVNSRLAADPDFNKPSLVLTIDLTGVSGVGSATGATYVISGPERTQRGLAASHLVEIIFPYFKSDTNGTSSAQSGVASFALNFDLNTGAVTSASGNVTSLNLPR